MSGRSPPDLLNAAETDDQAFEELVVLRAPHWLAAFDIIDADRGSMGAQQLRMDAADPHDDSAESERRIRRSVTNAIIAMRADRARTVGLLRELAAAMDEGRAPQPVDPDGRPEPENTPASQAWFDRTFPKAVQSVGRPSSVRMEIAAAPEETDSGTVERLRGELSALLDGIRESIRSVPEIAEEIRERARGAGIALPLTTTRADEMVVQLAQMARAMRELPDVILSLADAEDDRVRPFPAVHTLAGQNRRGLAASRAVPSGVGIELGRQQNTLFLSRRQANGEYTKKLVDDIDAPTACCPNL
ncbi:hypothetical protein E1292_13975 [Nonomuraea deserti]|uniref:Uncharacterized protein n=1 Tax=Nonomuraea deserti TaxID=1848322 RepID=A0A4R4VN69_9ACTN|nr:hypothetical protein [Nonomuraea deserti]TDD07142.1 hypothetical protein E1292_13975 [Nonomuraea deserti]